jgi:hypothetical protein
MCLCAYVCVECVVYVYVFLSVCADVCKMLRLTGLLTGKEHSPKESFYLPTTRLCYVLMCICMCRVCCAYMYVFFLSVCADVCKMLRLTGLLKGTLAKRILFSFNNTTSLLS